MIHALRLLPILLAVALAGCGSSLLDDPDLFCPAPDPAAMCLTDADCRADSCCGEGSCAVHVSAAPNCSTVRCDGSCPPGSVDCGCGLPVCRDGACTVARTVGGGC